MKKLFILCFMALLSLGSFAQNETFLIKSFNASDIRNLEVETSGGEINVSGSDASKATVKVYIKGNNGGHNLSKSEIEDRLKDYVIKIEKKGNTLVCKAKPTKQNNWKNGLSISFTIESPRNMDTEITTSGGGIQLSHLSGKLNFSISGGELSLADLSGEIHGRTSGGGIQLKNSKGNIDLGTSGGGIKVEYAKGEIKLSTSGGGISLVSMKGNIDAHTSGGTIKANDIIGELLTSTSGGSIYLAGIAASVKATTSGGSISAEILEVGEYLVLHTSAGSIDVKLPMDKGMDLNLRGGRVTMAYKNFEGDFDKNHMHGKINGGGANVDISANSGHVKIN